MVRHFLRFFRKFPGTIEEVLEGSIVRVYRGYEYLPKNNKIMEMDIDLELETKISRRELRVLLLHEFRLGRKATEATSNICGTMGKDVLSIRTAQHWFHRFKNGNFELDDLPHTGRP